MRETQEAAWELYDRETARALEVFVNDPVFQQDLNRTAEVENELTKPREQIVDPCNPGLGQKAKERLKQIEALHETKTTELVSPASTAALSEHRQYASALEGHIRTLMAEGNERGVVNGLSAINHEV